MPLAFSTFALAATLTLQTQVETTGVPESWDNPLILQKRVDSVVVPAGPSGGLTQTVRKHWLVPHQLTSSSFAIPRDFEFTGVTLEELLDTLEDRIDAFYWAVKDGGVIYGNTPVFGGRVSVKYRVLPLAQRLDESGPSASKITAELLAELVESAALPARPLATRSGRRVNPMGDWIHVWVTRREHRSIMGLLSALERPEAYRSRGMRKRQEWVDLLAWVLDQRVDMLVKGQPLSDFLAQLATDHSVPILAPNLTGEERARPVTLAPAHATLREVLVSVFKGSGRRPFITEFGIEVAESPTLSTMVYGRATLAAAFPLSAPESPPEEPATLGIESWERWVETSKAHGVCTLRRVGQAVIIRAPLGLHAEIQWAIEER